MTGGLGGQRGDPFQASLLVMPAYPDWFREWPGKEAEATELRWYEPLIVPGLLQTEAYACTLLRTRVGVTEDEFEAMLAARLERQVSWPGPRRPPSGCYWTRACCIARSATR